MGGKGSGGKSGHKLEQQINREFQRELRELGSLKIGLRNPAAVRERVQSYFDLCDKHGVIACKSGLNVALGGKFADYLNYKIKRYVPVDGNERKSIEILKDAVNAIENEMEQLVLSGSKGAIGAMFTLKCNYGWRETAEIVVNSGDNQLPSADAIRKKYAELPQEQASVPYVEYEMVETE